MPTKSNGRTAINPMSVRFNPEERAEARRKARLLSLRESAFVRVAVAEYDAEAAAARQCKTFHGEPAAEMNGAIPSVAYDADEAQG